MPTKEAAAHLYRHVLELLNVLEIELGESEFLTGTQPTIADFTAFTIFQTARERFNLPLGKNHLRLDAWYGRFRARPSADY